MASGTWINGTAGSGTWDVTNGVLTISGTGAMSDYTSRTYSKSPWYNYFTSVTSIVINSGITAIGNYSFAGSTSVTSVSIANTVTTIGSYSFDANRINTINELTNVTYIGDAAFAYNRLTTIKIPKVEYIGNAVFRMSTLTSIELPNTLTEIGPYAFAECNNLTSFVIPDSVTTMGSGAFYYCESLTSVRLSSNLTTINNSAFRGCTALTSIIIPDGVTTINDYAFYECTALASITFLSSSAPTMGSDSLYLGTSSVSVTATVYTKGGWGSDDVFTSDVKGDYTTFIYICQYAVNFDSHGGSISPPTQYIDEGQSITLPSAGTRSGYNFLGWYTASSGGTRVGGSGDSYTVTQSITLHAQWTLNIKYSLTLIHHSGITESVSVQSGTLYTLPTGKTNWANSQHYTSSGWYSGTTLIGKSGAQITIDRNLTLTMLWTPINYTVSFSVPSGVGSVADMVGTAFSYIALPNITGTIANKTFQGWSENADGSGTVYKVNYAYYPTGNRTLYAVFSDNYIVRLYRNYSASDSTTVQTFSVSQGKSVKLSNYPTPDYYYCTGWYDARSNGKLVGLQGANYTPTKSIDLYAHWQNCPVVTFDANGGIVEGAETLSVKTTGQSTFQIKSEDYPAVPTRNFHTFLGWYTITNERYDKDSVYTKSITLQARWSEVRITEIRLSVNGQTGEVILPEAGIVSTAKATIITSSSGESPDLSKIAWSSNNESLSVIVGADRTTAQIIPLDVSGNVTVLLTASISYDDAIVSGSIKLNLSQKIYLTLINDYAEKDSERTVTIPIDDVTHLPTTFPSVPTRKGYEFNAWLDTSTDALITSDTPILYNRRARARWFKAYDQWDKDNLIIQLYNAEGTAIVKQFAMGSVQSISTSYKISPTSIPTPMQTSESTFLIDTAVTMTLDVECTRVNPTLKDGESYDDDGEDYNYWTNRKWVNEMMSLVDRWQGQSDGVKVLYIPNDCDVYDLAEGEKAFGEYYPLIGSTSKDYKSGFLYKGRFYQGKNAYITSLIRSIDQTTPELTQVNIGFAIGGLKSRYV